MDRALTARVGQLIRRAGQHPWIAGVVVLLAGHAVFIVTRTYGTAGDWAFIELRTSDVFSTHYPLTGAWSRYGWNHPGPLMFNLLAVPYLLTGSSWEGLWLGAVVLNLTAIVASSRLFAPHSRALSMVFPLAGLWTLASGTPHLLTDPWNASLVVLPTITMVAATATVLLHDRRGLAVASVVFVATAQTHAGYGVLLLPMMAVVLVVGVRHWWRYTAICVAVGAGLCLPVLVDTIVHWPGNLVEAVRFMATASEAAPGFAETVRVIGRATSLSSLMHPRLPSFVAIVDRPPWGVLPGSGLVATAAAFVVARRRSWTAEQHALTGVGLLWLGGFLMVARTRGPLLVWLTNWVSAASAITWALVALVAAHWLVDRWAAPGERMVQVELASTCAVAVLLSIVNVTGSVGVGYPFQELRPVIIQFAAEAAPLLTTPLAIDIFGDEYVAGAVQSGLIVEFEAMGLHPLARPDQGLQMGPHRAVATLHTRHLLVRVESTSRAPDGATEVSVWDPLSAAERDEADALVVSLGDLLTKAGLLDRLPLLDNDLAGLAAYDAPDEVVAQQSSFARLVDLRRAGPRIVLYLIG